MSKTSIKTFNTLLNYFGYFEYGIHQNKTETKKEFCITAQKYLGKETVTFDDLHKLNFKGFNIFMRPTFDVEQNFLLLDDIKQENIEKHLNKPGRLIIQTSPCNYQVWVKSDRELSNEEKKFWIKELGADTGASPKHRWGRAPVFRNNKPKYNDIGYPLVIIVTCNNEAVSIPIVASPVEKHVSIPDRKIFISRNEFNISRSDYEKGNESETDFAFTLALLRRGASDNYVYQRLLSERADFHRSENNINKYINRTIERAKSVL